MNRHVKPVGLTQCVFMSLRGDMHLLGDALIPLFAGDCCVCGNFLLIPRLGNSQPHLKTRRTPMPHHTGTSIRMRTAFDPLLRTPQCWLPRCLQSHRQPIGIWSYYLTIFSVLVSYCLLSRLSLINLQIIKKSLTFAPDLASYLLILFSCVCPGAVTSQSTSRP